MSEDNKEQQNNNEEKEADNNTEQHQELQKQNSAENQPTEKKKNPLALFVVAGSFLAVIVGGLWWGFTATSGSPVGGGWYLFSFAMGLTMIVLPCTFPLAFVIVPLAMGKGPMKGFTIATAFAAGVAITLSMYGVVVAAVGAAAVDSFGADLEVVKNWMYFIAGIFAYIFALGELGYIKAKMPTFSGAAPMVIQRQGPVMKALLLGLFLGNIGVGCPHPATPVILTRIAVSGDVFYGWLLFFVHALGRVIPLLFLALLGILGVNGLKILTTHRKKIEKATGWMMVFVAGFILVLGLFTHDWWVNSGQHTILESITQESRFTSILRGNLDSDVQHAHGLEDGPGMFGLPLWLGNWVLVLLWVAPLWVWYNHKRKALCAAIDCTKHNTKEKDPFPGIHLVTKCEYTDESLAEEEIMAEKRAMRPRFWGVIALTLLLIVTFAYWLPGRFERIATEGHGEEMHEGAHAGHHMALPSSEEVSALPLYTFDDRVDELSYTTTSDGFKEFKLTATEFRWQVSPDLVVHAWGYNNQVPGPTIRVNEGDKVRVVVENNLSDATTVHWHGLDVPFTEDGVPNITQEPIEPGETYIYEFTATPAGTRWYHSHGKNHITSAQQLDMGLAGAFIIKPNNPQYSYDSEQTLVLDEWNIQEGGINPAVGHVHGAGVDGAVPEYNTFTINGNIFPYIDPIVVKEGETTLVRIVNAGTSAFHPMHLHGHQFKVVAKDGNPLRATEDRNVLMLHPGETADLLVRADNPGPWLLHCHHVHHAAAGMIMLLQYEGYEPVVDPLEVVEEMSADSGAEATENHHDDSGAPPHEH